MGKPENKTESKKLQMLEALEKSLGVVSSAAKSVGIDRSTHYDWINKDSERFDNTYSEAVKMIEGVALDFVESQLFQKIQGVKKVIETDGGKEIVYKKEPDTAAIIFYLKTKGKKRGYIEKIQTEDLTERKPLEVIVKRNDVSN
tara:strand:+ start:3220 stop:3651 length:432 start_codon:yes stop_codon:yes gene_type:complete